MGNSAVWPPNGQGIPHSYTLFSPLLGTSPKIARDFTASVLRSLELDHIVAAAKLCTSELVTNALQHAPYLGSLLWLDIEPTHVRINVYDASPSMPVPRWGSGEHAENGRGLALVADLADRWGITPGGPIGLGGVDGKGVWCEIGTGG